jgi:hypothetical protein
MQSKSVNFGLSGNTVDFMIGHFLATQMHDEVSQKYNMGEEMPLSLS